MSTNRPHYQKLYYMYVSGMDEHKILAAIFQRELLVELRICFSIKQASTKMGVALKGKNQFPSFGRKFFPLKITPNIPTQDYIPWSVSIHFSFLEHTVGALWWHIFIRPGIFTSVPIILHNLQRSNEQEHHVKILTLLFICLYFLENQHALFVF